MRRLAVLALVACAHPSHSSTPADVVNQLASWGKAHGGGACAITNEAVPDLPRVSLTAGDLRLDVTIACGPDALERVAGQRPPVLESSFTATDPHLVFYTLGNPMQPAQLCQTVGLVNASDGKGFLRFFDTKVPTMLWLPLRTDAFVPPGRDACDPLDQDADDGGTPLPDADLRAAFVKDVLGAPAVCHPHGQITVELNLHRDGHIGEVGRFTSTLPPDVEKCVLDAIGQARVPPLHHPGLRLAIPIQF